MFWESRSGSIDDLPCRRAGCDVGISVLFGLRRCETIVISVPLEALQNLRSCICRRLRDFAIRQVEPGARSGVSGH